MISVLDTLTTPRPLIQSGSVEIQASAVGPSSRPTHRTTLMSQGYEKVGIALALAVSTWVVLFFSADHWPGVADYWVVVQFAGSDTLPHCEIGPLAANRSRWSIPDFWYSAMTGSVVSWRATDPPGPITPTA